MQLINVQYKTLFRPYPEYCTPLLVICAQERWIETEIYPGPPKQDNQGNEESLSSEKMETFGFFSPEKQKLRDDSSHQNGKYQRREQGLLKIKNDTGRRTKK